MTFQSMLPGCEAGSAEAWRAFLATYTPIASRLLEVHAPQLPADARRAVWQDAVRALAADGFKRLRDLDHQGEREFLIDLKSLLLDFAKKQIGDTAFVNGPAIESLRARVEGRPIAHQEIILLQLSGYGPAAIHKVLIVPETLVAKALEAPQDSEPAPGSWLGLLQEVRAARTEHCPPPRLFARIFDGQISWYDKTPAENHLLACPHCLDVWASLREADFLRRDTPLAPETESANYLTALPALQETASRSWWSRLLGR